MDRRKYDLIENSPTDIPQRLQEISPSYYVLFNKHTQKFEIHSSDFAHYTYCLTIPYPELDSRAIDLLCKQLRQNQEALAREIEEHNEKLDRQKAATCRDTLDEMTKDLYKYGKSTVREVKPIVKGVMY